MSSTSPTTPTSSESPTASSTQPSGGALGGGTSNLYLVTFLATLFLLLFVSCAIVLRSYILRRRYQRRLEEAMASGLLLAPRAQGSKRKRFGTKPKLFDVWLSHTGSHWKHLMPLAAQPVFVKRKFKEPAAKQPPIIPATATSTAINPTLGPGTPPSPSTPVPNNGILNTSQLPGSDSNHLLTPTPATPPSGIRPFTAQELTYLATERDRHMAVEEGLLDFMQIPHDDPRRHLYLQPQPTPQSRSRPWGWFGRRNRANDPLSAAARDADDADADEDDYDVAPVSATSPVTPTLFSPAAVMNPSNRNSSPSRATAVAAAAATGPVSLTHAYLFAGPSASTPNLDESNGANASRAGLDAAARRAAVAAGAVPGGSMPLGVMAVAGAPAGTYKVRVEMLQVTTLIAMPCPPGRDGKPRVRRIRGVKAFGKRRLGAGKSVGEEEEGTTESDGSTDDDDEEEEDKPLPELVFGVTRVNHSSNKAAQAGLVGRMKEF